MDARESRLGSSQLLRFDTCKTGSATSQSGLCLPCGRWWTRGYVTGSIVVGEGGNFVGTALPSALPLKVLSRVRPGQQSMWPIELRIREVIPSKMYFFSLDNGVVDALCSSRGLKPAHGWIQVPFEGNWRFDPLGQG